MPVTVGDAVLLGPPIGGAFGVVLSVRTPLGQVGRAHVLFQSGLRLDFTLEAADMIAVALASAVAESSD